MSSPLDHRLPRPFLLQKTLFFSAAQLTKVNKDDDDAVKHDKRISEACKWPT